MADFNVRSDSVDVEQIMRQIRARIREKRGADYTEAELQQLADVKLEKFLDPRGVRSDLVETFRRQHVVSPEPLKYTFEDTTIYETHRGILRMMRRWLNPILKLFVNPNPLISAMHVQTLINADMHVRMKQREEMDPLFFEVIHNLVVELTRAGIEVQNLKMRVESLSSRMDFDERRARSLETVVQYRPSSESRPSDSRPPATNGPAPTSASEPQQSAGAQGRPDGGGGRPPNADGAAGNDRRRRRRRRRRRPGQTMGDGQDGWAARAPQGPDGSGGGSHDGRGGGDHAPDSGDESSDADGSHEPDSSASSSSDSDQ